jgi:hypothetical protein
VLGGVVFLEAGELDEAVSFAATWPSPRRGTSIEVRPVTVNWPGGIGQAGGVWATRRACKLALGRLVASSSARRHARRAASSRPQARSSSPRVARLCATTPTLCLRLTGAPLRTYPSSPGLPSRPAMGGAGYLLVG